MGGAAFASSSSWGMMISPASRRRDGIFGPQRFKGCRGSQGAFSQMSPAKQATFSLLLVVLAAAGWYVYEHPGMVGMAREDAGASGVEDSGSNRIPGLLGEGRAVNVVTAAVQADASGERVVAVGSAKAAQSVTIFPQVTGIVTKVLFSPGEAVEAGAVLVMLDDEEEQAAADRARIEYAQARAALERSRALAESKTISNVALSEAEMAAQLAENGVRTAEIAAKRRVIRAPFAGVVGLTDISVGDMVSPTTAITMLDDLATVRVGFEVPERWAEHVVQGQPIAATAQGLPGSQFTGRISAIDNHVDETTRTLRLEAELSNPAGVLKGGMAVTVILDFRSDQELMVPSLAVQWDRRGSFVWKVAEGAARRADVTVVKRESGIVIVRGDISAGDRVVVEGTQRLREGAKVVEVDETPAMADEEGTPPPSTEDVPEVSGAGAPARTRS